MRAALALLMLLIVTLTAAGCGGPGEEALNASRDREEKQHKGEEPSDANRGESKVNADASQDENEASGDNREVDVASGDDDTGLEETQDQAGKDEATKTPAGGAVDVEQGRELFGGACSSCHTLADADATGTFGPNLDETEMDTEEILEQIVSGGGGMPPALLTGEDADTVAAYVAQAAAK